MLTLFACRRHLSNKESSMPGKVPVVLSCWKDCGKVILGRGGKGAGLITFTPGKQPAIFRRKIVGAGYWRKGEMCGMR